MKKRILSVFLMITLVLIGVVGLVSLSGCYKEQSLAFYISSIGDVWVQGGTPDSNGTLVIPSEYEGYTVREIRGSAFWGDSKIKKVVIPSTVQVIHSAAFRKSSVEEVIFEEDSDLYRVAELAFAETEKLKAIVFPDSVTKIGNSVFRYSAIEYFEMPLGMTEVPDAMFYGTWKLKTVKLHTGITRIGSGAFSGMQGVDFSKPCNIETVIIPDSVTHIESGAFADTNSLKEIIIPYNVIYLDSTFRYWIPSQTIYIEGRTEPPDTWASNWNEYCDARIVFLG